MVKREGGLGSRPGDRPARIEAGLLAVSAGMLKLKGTGTRHQPDWSLFSGGPPRRFWLRVRNSCLHARARARTCACVRACMYVSAVRIE